MNSRQRMENAIAGRPTDRVAVAPCYLELYLDERIRSAYVEAYRHKLAGRQHCAIDHAEDCRFRAGAVRQAYQVFAEQPDWMHVPYAESHAWAEQGEVQVLDGRLFYVNRDTGARAELGGPNSFLLPASLAFIDTNDAGADAWDKAGGLTRPEDLEALAPVRSAEELEAEGFFDAARILVQELGDRVFLRCDTGAPYWYAYTVFGFSGMMVMMREQPDLFCQLMERKHRQRLEVCRGFARAGIHGVWVEECLSSADLISPRHYERFAFSTTRAFIADLNRLGLITILYYCGDVVPRLPWLKQIGAAALAVEESKKGFTIDLTRVVAGLDGACAVFGNVDSVRVVQEGGAGEIAVEVERQVAVGRQAKGFVLSQGSPFPLDVEPAQVDAFMAAARQLHPA